MDALASLLGGRQLERKQSSACCSGGQMEQHVDTICRHTNGGHSFGFADLRMLAAYQKGFRV